MKGKDNVLIVERLGSGETYPCEVTVVRNIAEKLILNKLRGTNSTNLFIDDFCETVGYNVTVIQSLASLKSKFDNIVIAASIDDFNLERLQAIADEVIMVGDSELRDFLKSNGIVADKQTPNDRKEGFKQPNTTYQLSFSEALTLLRSGRTLARQGWNASGMYLKCQFPDEYSKMTSPYLYLTIPKGTQSNIEEGERRVPWQPAQVDLFSNDWAVVE